MSCEACIFSAKQLRQDFDQVKAQAKAYAQEHQTPTAVYFDGQRWDYCPYERAIAEQLPIREVLSQH